MLLAVIQSLDRADLIARALPSLHRALGEARIPAKIMVFDAGSTDGTVDWLRDYRRRVRHDPAVDLLLEPAGERPLSFSEGTNHAIAAGLRAFPEARYILLFETDNQLLAATPLRTAIDLLARHTDFAALGFTVRKADGRPTGCAQNFPTVLQFVCGLRIADYLERLRDIQAYRPVADEPDLCEVDAAYTSPMLVRRDVWQQIQGFDATRFPFSDCDIDFCWRCRKHGHRIGIVKTDAVVHDNLGRLSPWSTRRVAAWHQGRYRLLARHVGRRVRYALPLLVARHACEVVALGILALLGRRPRPQVAARLRLLGAALVGYRTVA